MSKYDVAQLEPISRTIFEYEKERFYGTPSQATYAAETLVTGEPSAQLSWSLNVKLGTLPVDLKRKDSDGHHLDYVCAFAAHPEIRDQFLERLRKDIAEEDDSGFSGTLFHPARATPGPTTLELRLDRGRTRLFHPYHAAWYTPRALVKLATEQLTYRYSAGTFLAQVGAALERSGQSSEVLSEVATKAVVRELDNRAKASTDFGALAGAAVLADQAVLEDKLMHLGGVYQNLCLALRRSKPETMVAGLRAAASYKRLEILSYMGRAPTLEELLRSNVKGTGNVWRLMPWEIFGPLVQEHGAKLRAALMKRTELSFDELRQCLVDHDKRLPRKVAAPRTDVSAKETLSEWSRFADGLQRYFPATRVRAVLNDLFPVDVAKLIAFRHITDRSDLGTYVDHILPDAARHALAAFETPMAWGGRSAYEVP
jgi:hypothetical protein